MYDANRKPHPRATRSMRIGAALAAGAWGLLIWMFWQTMLTSFSLVVDPRLTIGWTVLVTLVFLRLYAWGPQARRSRARVRLRSPGRAWKWIAFTAPALAVLPHALWIAMLAFGVARDAPLPDYVVKFTARPYGEVAFWMLVLAVVPLVEEFGFRGWIQRPLERQLGGDAAITVSALLFALMHMQPDAIPVRLAGGLVLGYAVYATRSLWAGLALHCAWNGGVLVLVLLDWDADPAGKGWAWGGPAAALALACLVWCAWGVRRMQDESGRLPPGGRAARGSPVASS